MGYRAGIQGNQEQKGQDQEELRIGTGSDQIRAGQGRAGEGRCRLKVKTTGSKVRMQGERHQGKDVRACWVFIRLQ